MDDAARQVNPPEPPETHPPTVADEEELEAPPVQQGRLSRAGHAMFNWVDQRVGISRDLWPIAAHPVPKTTNWWYVLGSATLIAFVMQVVTGVALAFTYVPAPNSAYDSLAWISNEATLGSVVRGIHYWGASAMVILIVLHMCRTFAFGSYKYPREMNWLSGVVLLLLTLGLAVTGQLLRWDQDAYWAVYVAAEQAARVPYIGNFIMQIVIAGDTVGGNTLTRFYATHVFLLPAISFLMIGLHLYLLIRHGISEAPVAGEPVNKKTYELKYKRILEKNGMPFWPDAAWKDVVFALLVGSVVLALAIWLGPKALGEVADPTILQAHPKPDWYFLSLFAVLALMPPGLEDYLIIGIPLLLGGALIAVPFIRPEGERAPSRRPWALGVIAFSFVAVGVLTWLGSVAPWSPDLDPKPLPADVQARAVDAGLERGSAIFSANGCLNCHSIGGSGGHKGPDLTYVGDHLNKDELTWRILYGGNGMPPYGQTLTAEDANVLVAFLQQQTHDQGEVATPAP
jgi:ubiquinol-cytochrome c reductase cytochrome b subunit